MPNILMINWMTGLPTINLMEYRLLCNNMTIHLIQIYPEAAVLKLICSATKFTNVY